MAKDTKDPKDAAARKGDGGPTDIMRAHNGPFTLRFYQRMLERIQETGAVLSLSVSSGVDERIFFFTRGAILFLAVGNSGGEVFARKVLAKKLVPKEKLDDLRRNPPKSATRGKEQRPLLQDSVRESGTLGDDVVAELVNEILEDHLLEVALWEGDLALYDVLPGNPPPRLYEPNVPAVRLSIGLRALLASVIPKIAEIPDRILRPLEGSLKNRVRLGAVPENAKGEPLPTGDPTTDVVLKCVPKLGRSAVGVVAAAQRLGVPAYQAALKLAQLVGARQVLVSSQEKPTKDESVQSAEEIEGLFDQFVNRVLVRKHLASIYEKVDEKEKAGDNLRAVAEEQVSRDQLEDAIQCLGQALVLVPKDLPAREGLVKVLQTAGKPQESAAQAVALGDILLELGLVGRARNALEMAVKLCPTALDGLWKLATLLAALGERDEAIRRYEQIAEAARLRGDKESLTAAKQQVLSLNPKDRNARSVVRAVGGWRRTLLTQVGVAGVALVVSGITAASAANERAAWRAFHEAEETAWANAERGFFDRARAAVDAYSAAWSIARAVQRAEGLRSELGAAERVRITQEVRAADRLEREGRVPEALEKLRGLSPSEADRKAEIAASIARCEGRLTEATRAVARVSEHRSRGELKLAHDVIALAVQDFPWLGLAGDMTLPCQIESIPPGAEVLINGSRAATPTPTVIEWPVRRGVVVVRGRDRESVAHELPALPPWPVVVPLPREAVWTLPGANGDPVVAPERGLVLAAGVDRHVTAVETGTGKVVWRRFLGVFGDVAGAPTIFQDRLVVLRFTNGSVLALDLAKGDERWRRAVPAPPATAGIDAARPVEAGSDGILVREGANALVLLRPDGAPAWRKELPGAIKGAPASTRGLALVAHGHTITALGLATGSRSWQAELKDAAAAGPVLGPRESICVRLENGAIGRLERDGGASPDLTVTGQKCVALDADEQRLLVGTATGAVALFDARWRLQDRKALGDKPISWVQIVPGALLVGDEGSFGVFDTRLVELWRDASCGAPAVGVPGQVFQAGPRGLRAFAR